MNIFKTLHRILFPVNLETIFSEKSKEETALGVAARISDDVNVQSGRVTTQRKFDDEMAQLAKRVLSRNAAISP